MWDLSHFNGMVTAKVGDQEMVPSTDGKTYTTKKLETQADVDTYIKTQTQLLKDSFKDAMTVLVNNPKATLEQKLQAACALENLTYDPNDNHGQGPHSRFNGNPWEDPNAVIIGPGGIANHQNLTANVGYS